MIKVMITDEIMNFERDYSNGMKARELKTKYNLSNRSYRFLKEKLNLKRNPICKVKREAKHYYKCNGGGYSIIKMINGELVYYCKVDNEEEAKKVVEKLRLCQWDKREIYRILYEVTNDL